MPRSPWSRLPGTFAQGAGHPILADGPGLTSCTCSREQRKAKEKEEEEEKEKGKGKGPGRAPSGPDLQARTKEGEKLLTSVGACPKLHNSESPRVGGPVPELSFRLLGQWSGLTTLKVPCAPTLGAKGFRPDIRDARAEGCTPLSPSKERRLVTPESPRR